MLASHFAYWQEWFTLYCALLASRFSLSCTCRVALVKMFCEHVLYFRKCSSKSINWFQFSHSVDFLIRLRSSLSCHCSWWCLITAGFKLFLWTSFLLLYFLRIVFKHTFFHSCVHLIFLSYPLPPFILFQFDHLHLWWFTINIRLTILQILRLVYHEGQGLQCWWHRQGW